MATLLKFGITTLLVGLGLWVYENEFENTLPISSNLDVWFATAGAIAMAIFGLLAAYGLITGTTAKWGRKSKCIKCGVKIPKNSMYCDFHKQENANKFLKRDSTDIQYDDY